MKIVVFFVLGICSLVGLSHQANILMVSTLISHSHHFWNEAIALGLVNAGHNVTMFSLDSTKVVRENFTVFEVPGIYEQFESVYEEEKLKGLNFEEDNIINIINLYWELLSATCSSIVNSEHMQKFLDMYPEGYKFDLILWDLITGECLYGLVDRFGNPPLVGISAYGSEPHIDEMFGATIYTQIPITMMPYTKKATLYERILKVAFHLFFIYRRDSYMETSAQLGRKIDPTMTAAKIKEIERRFALFLMNWNVAFNQVQAWPPNMIPVGGAQIKNPKPLSKDLQAIYDVPSEGVIYFSLGSNIRSEFMGKEFLQSFMECFESLPEYQVLWKVQLPENSGVKQPENVKTHKWYPQTDILAQKKTKLFITHGGGLSTQESTYFGVPILGVPIFLDQYNNAEKLSVKGGGEIIRYETINTESVCRKIKNILKAPDQRYHKAMKNLSDTFKDTPLSPIDTAVFWVEYILRHGGGEHLSPIIRDLPYWQSQNLDIYLLVLIIVVVALLISGYLIFSLYSLFLRSLSKHSASNEKKRN